MNVILEDMLDLVDSMKKTSVKLNLAIGLLILLVLVIIGGVV